jgi:uncharacterized protein YdhG (YjbR/CyaY superfamily)
MAERKTTTQKTRTTSSNGWTAEERAAMKEHTRELKAACSSKADPEAEVLAKISAMKGSDRTIAKRLHSLIKETAPELGSKTWYGMPAYTKEGKIVCFFQDANKFKARYAMLGFTDNANLDEGSMWPVYYALKELNGTEERKIKALLKTALS